jgi:dual specificity phosphatase 12
MSRSATIVGAYVMKKYRLSYDATLQRLKSKRSIVCPNEGFERQLRLYHTKRQRQPLKASDDTNEKIRTVNEPSISDDNKHVSSGVDYRCKVCRHIVFTNDEVLKHISGKGRFDPFSRGSAYKARQNAESTDEDYCYQQLFTNQPYWLTEIYDTVIPDGDIGCPNPKCHAKLGRYNLSGEKCSCARWINPAFHFHRSKLDECSRATQSNIQRYLLKEKLDS